MKRTLIVLFLITFISFSGVARTSYMTTQNQLELVENANSIEKRKHRHKRKVFKKIMKIHKTKMKTFRKVTRTFKKKLQ